MKKVLALVLAVMMLATVAFAVADVTPGKKIKLERDSGKLVKADGVTVSVKVSNKNDSTADAFPWLDLGDRDAADDLAKALNSDNYRITKIKYNEGRNLIDTIDLDDDDEQVVITLGSRGVYLATQERRGLIPAFRVDAVDTTGAGDAFNGGLVAALAEGKDLWEAARFANGLAALSVQKLGTTPSMPAREEIDRFLAEH